MIFPKAGTLDLQFMIQKATYVAFCLGEQAPPSLMEQEKHIPIDVVFDDRRLHGAAQLNYHEPKVGDTQIF